MALVSPAEGYVPGLGFLFRVEFDGTINGTFAECSGLSAEMRVDTWEEGGRNDAPLQFPGPSQYGNLTFSYGLTATNEMFRWLRDPMLGKDVRKPVSIIMNGAGNTEMVGRWDFERAFPVRWSGPSFSAAGSDVAIETLELSHEGLTDVRHG